MTKPLPPKTLEEKLETRWPTKTRKIAYGKPPTGYMPNPENPLELIPDPVKVEWLEKAFDYMEAGNTIRETCEWFNQKTKMTIVHQTLNNCYDKHRRPFTFKATDKKKATHKHSKDTRKIIAEKTRARHALNRAKKIEEAVAVPRVSTTPAVVSHPMIWVTSSA